jgi:hypothetical protein
MPIARRELFGAESGGSFAGPVPLEAISGLWDGDQHKGSTLEQTRRLAESARARAGRPCFPWRQVSEARSAALPREGSPLLARRTREHAARSAHSFIRCGSRQRPCARDCYCRHLHRPGGDRNVSRPQRRHWPSQHRRGPDRSTSCESEPARLRPWPVRPSPGAPAWDWPPQASKRERASSKDGRSSFGSSSRHDKPHTARAPRSPPTPCGPDQRLSPT